MRQTTQALAFISPTLRTNHAETEESALFALALLPIAAVAQMPTRAAAHAETANERQTQVTAIEQLLKQFHDAVVTHDGATLSGLFLPDASLLVERAERHRLRSRASEGGEGPKGSSQQLS